MVLFPLFHGLLAFFFLSKAYGVLTEDRIRCTTSTYGSPRPVQCSRMLNAFASFGDQQARYFDEEQLRANELDWPGVVNIYRTEIVQLPAYWSSGTCNIGLYGDQIPSAFQATAGLSSWRNVATAGIELINRCLVVGSGGSIYVKSFDGRYSAANLVMWESGSYFEVLSNAIQNTPRTMRPDLMGLLNGTMSMSAINATLRLNSTAAASVKLPWNFTTTSQD